MAEQQSRGVVQANFDGLAPQRHLIALAPQGLLPNGGRWFRLPVGVPGGASAGAAQMLPNAVRQKMEQFFSADLSSVQVHVNSGPSRLGALAFATGNQIHFAPGRYQPYLPSGQKLLAHELTHVLQQRAGRAPNHKTEGLALLYDDELEAEAHRNSQRFAGPTISRAASPVAQSKRSARPPGAPLIQAAMARIAVANGADAGVIQAMTQEDYDEVKKVADSILFLFHATDFYFVGPGGSPGPFFAYMKARLGNDVELTVFPMSGIKANAVLRSSADTLYGRMQPLLAANLLGAREVGKKKVLLVDYSTSGMALQYAKRFVCRYYAEDAARSRVRPPTVLSLCLTEDETNPYRPNYSAFARAAYDQRGIDYCMKLGQSIAGKLSRTHFKDEYRGIYRLGVGKYEVDRGNYDAATHGAMNMGPALADMEEAMAGNYIPSPARRAPAGGWVAGPAPAANGRSCCFITTACVRARGLPDDCEELIVLRAFRDQFVSALDDGKSLLARYYEEAPRVVAAIEARRDAREIWDSLYQEIDRCVTLVREGRPEDALAIYASVFMTLLEVFGEHSPIIDSPTD